MIPTTPAEAAVLAVLLWGLYRLLEPLGRGAERALRRLLSPGSADIIDAQVVRERRKNREEPR